MTAPTDPRQALAGHSPTGEGRGVTLYLLHFHPPLATGEQHYLGACYDGNLDARLTRHARSAGARLTRRAFEARCFVYVVRTVSGRSWADEKRIKQKGHLKRLCPICTPDLQKWHPPPYPRLVAASPPTPTRGFKSFSSRSK